MEIFTERLQADARGIARAAELLRAGETVALPTETVYGLAANALEVSAVAKIFEAKDRPSWDPLIVHIADEEMLSQVVQELSEAARKLISKFWPGPLTLLLPKSDQIPAAVTAGRELVGVRMPAHEVMQQVIRAAGVPLAAPSANRFGRTSPTTMQHVLEDLDGRIAAVLDGGPTTIGVESTVVEASHRPIVVYRPGAVTLEMLREVAGEVEMYVPPMAMQKPEGLPSPGVGIRHYAPRARVQVITSQDELNQWLSRSVERVGVMLPTGWNAVSGEIFDWGIDSEAQAKRLFAGFRELDGRGVGMILCPLPDSSGVGAALRDRIEKAARKV